MKKLKISMSLLILFFYQCGESALLKDPMRLSVEQYESRSTTPVLLAGKDANCKPLIFKHIVNALFVLPVNQLSSDELLEISKQEMVRYKNVMRWSDIFWTTLLFLSGTITYSVEVETCKSEYVILKESDLNAIKKGGGAMSREIQSLEASANLNAPVLLNYNKFVNYATELEPSTSTVFFPTKSNQLSNKEEIKILQFIKTYNEKYSKYNILLVGHADYKGTASKNIELSLERVKSVKEYMKKSGVDELKIFTTSSGDYWPGNNEEKQGKAFNRRVDVILME